MGNEADGRGDEPGAAADRLVATLRATRLTVLCGAAGAGKTRLLREEVLPRLRRRTGDRGPGAPADTSSAAHERRRRLARPRELVVWCDRWEATPAAEVSARLDAAAGAASTDPAASPAVRAKALSAERGARLLVVIDGVPDAVAATPAYDALVNALCSVSPSVHVLVSARDEALPPSVLARLGGPDTHLVRLHESPAVDIALDPEARPLVREDVYASIAERLGSVARRPSEAPWGGAAVTAPVVDADTIVAPTEAARPVPGSFAEAAACRARTLRRRRAAAGAVGVAIVAGAAALLWPAPAGRGSLPLGERHAVPPAVDPASATGPAPPAPRPGGDRGAR